MRVLSGADVARCLGMADALRLVARAFVELSAGRATAPLRAAVPLDAHEGRTLVMPGYVAADDALSVKVVSLHDRNPDRGLPRIHGAVLLVDPATGRPRALLDGRVLTALRTGAASGVATGQLARDDAATLAVFGAGPQARTQIVAVLAVRAIRRIRVFARRARPLETFVEAMRTECGPGIEIGAARSPDEAVRDADVVCAATNSATPVFDGAALRPGAHVNGVGSYTPAMRELDATTLRRADRIVVDEREAALAEAGELIAALADGTLDPSRIGPELGEILAGARPGRVRDDEITVFKSVGNAVQDAVVAKLVADRAERDGIGTEVGLD